MDRVRLLTSLLAIDVCAHAILSDHYRLLLKVCLEQLEGISDDDIMDLWCALFKGPFAGATLSRRGRLQFFRPYYRIRHRNCLAF